MADQSKNHPGNAATQLRSGAWECALAPFHLFIGKQPVSPRTVSHRTLISQIIHTHLEAAIHPGFDPKEVKIGLGDKSCSNLKPNCFWPLWSRRSSLKWSLNQEVTKQWPIRKPNGFQPLLAAIPAWPCLDVSRPYSLLLFVLFFLSHPPLQLLLFPWLSFVNDSLSLI